MIKTKRHHLKFGEKLLSDSSLSRFSNMEVVVHLDEAYLDSVWKKVASFQKKLFEEEANVGFIPVITPWQKMSPKEKRGTALRAIEGIMRRQFQNFIDVFFHF